MINKKIYLGDSVYAQYNGRLITLTTENGFPDDPSNTIHLEGEVLDALINFRDRIIQWIKDSKVITSEAIN